MLLVSLFKEGLPGLVNSLLRSYYDLLQLEKLSFSSMVLLGVHGHLGMLLFLLEYGSLDEVPSIFIRRHHA